MHTLILLAVVFLAGVLTGTYGHAIATGSPRRRKPGRQQKLTPAAEPAEWHERTAAVADIAAALKNLGAPRAAALSAARKVVADLPAAEFSERFRAALVELPNIETQPRKGRHAIQ